MLTKMNIALAAALVVATSSAALAQNRDVGTPTAYQRPPAPARLHSRDVSLPARQTDSQDWFEVDRNDRASSPYAGGGG